MCVYIHIYIYMYIYIYVTVGDERELETYIEHWSLMKAHASSMLRQKPKQKRLNT